MEKLRIHNKIVEFHPYLPKNRNPKQSDASCQREKNIFQQQRIGQMKLYVFLHIGVEGLIGHFSLRNFGHL